MWYSHLLNHFYVLTIKKNVYSKYSINLPHTRFFIRTNHTRTKGYRQRKRRDFKKLNITNFDFLMKKKPEHVKNISRLKNKKKLRNWDASSVF